MMARGDIALPPRCASGAARGLRTWRALHGVKQSHMAEMLGVRQVQVSRWESGQQQPGPGERAAIVELLTARLTGDADRTLARFVRETAAPMHLVCDLTHRLLAYSPARARQFRRSSGELDGRSLWACASAEISRAEEALEDLGWYDLPAPSLELHTGAHRSDLIEIPESVFRWTRFRLSDGTHARLVETLDPR